MGAADSEAAAFSRALAALKREGCNVLVVSDPGGSEAVCERLLGGHDLDRRHVFLPTTTTVDDVVERHGDRSRDPRRFGVVDATSASATRSAAAVQPTESLGPGPTIESDPEWYDAVDDLTDLESMLSAVRRHLDRLADAGSGAPGELRFCFDSLDPLLDAVPEDVLFRFVHLLTAAIRETGGMGHFHTSASAGATLETLEPLFDATLRVETAADGTVEQRWRLTDSGIETDWFALD